MTFLSVERRAMATLAMAQADGEWPLAGCPNLFGLDWLRVLLSGPFFVPCQTCLEGKK
jgi:hypothetical protein